MTTRRSTSPTTAPVLAVLVAALLVAGCQGTADEAADGSPDASLASAVDQEPAPSIPPADTPVDPEVAAAIELLGRDPGGAVPGPALDRLAMSADVRPAWILVDRLRFAAPGDQARLVEALASLTGVAAPVDVPAWVAYSDLLLGWDVPAPPGYPAAKRTLFLDHEPAWRPYLPDGTDLDWRRLTATGLEPAAGSLDDPEVVVASEGSWLDAEEPVLGVRLGDEYRAYPLRVLAGHRVVNDTLGGEPIVVSWCETCGAALVHRATLPVDVVPGPTGGALRLQPSGLRLGGDELLADPQSGSLVEQLAGTGISGPLADVALAPVPAVGTTWASWRLSHPTTTVISADGGVGRIYVDLADPGRAGTVDATPRGPVDDRLAADLPVLGVIGPAGPVAFPADVARAVLGDGGEVRLGDVVVTLEAGGLAAEEGAGEDVVPMPAAEVRWWVWSQRHPDTAVWAG